MPYDLSACGLVTVSLFCAKVAVESPSTGKVALAAGTSNGGNDIFRWYDGSTQLGVFKNSGNVGIGTDSPATRLQIKGTNQYHQISACFFSTYNAGFSFSDDLAGITYDAGTNSLCLYSDYTGYGKVVISTCGAPRLTATVNGNIGIGTGIPDAKLHICNAVAGNTDNFLIIVQNCCTVSGARAGIAFSNNNQTPSAGGLSGASIQTSNNGIDGTGNLLFGTLLSGTNTERMRISHNGRVGIGTTSPSTMLQICGDVSGENTAWIQNTNSAGYGSLRALNNLNCAAVFGVGGSTVGAPYANTGYLYTDANVNFVFSIGTTEKMKITSAGNVGINCSAPTYKLHVNGTFYAAGSSQDYKQSICNYNTDSCMFMKLKPVTYQYKEEYCHLGKELKSGTQIGLIAEEVAESHPELAILVNEEENKVVRNVDYEKLSVILLSEVQKLRREVDDLKHKQ